MEEVPQLSWSMLIPIIKKRAELLASSLITVYLLILLEDWLPRWTQPAYQFSDTIQLVVSIYQRNWAWTWVIFRTLLHVIFIRLHFGPRMLLISYCANRLQSQFLLWLELQKCEDMSDDVFANYMQAQDSSIYFLLLTFMFLQRFWHWSTAWRMMWLVTRRSVSELYCFALFSWIEATWGPFDGLRISYPIMRLCLTTGKILARLRWTLLETVIALVKVYIPSLLQRRMSRVMQGFRQRKENDKFMYTDLPGGQIRLLILEQAPWWRPSVVKASLKHVPLNDAGEYEAVSYRWGSSERTDEFLIDGRSFPITASALNVLLSRRSIWRSKTIWIDAICIDQSNDVEKCEQMELMLEIYRTAYRVIAVPGGDWRSYFVFDQILYLMARGLERSTLAASAPPLSRGRLTNYERNLPHWRAFADFLTDEYFTRLWVLQELVVARQVRVYHGGKYIPWEYINGIFKELVDPGHTMALVLPGRGKSPLSNSAAINVTAVAALRKSFATVRELTAVAQLEEVIFLARGFRATDPRDAVFGLLGLAGKACQSSLLRPDYTKSPERVFEDVMQYALFASGAPSLNFLALAGIGFSTSERLSLPSWVPDLTEVRRCRSTFTASAASEQKCYHAATCMSTYVEEGPRSRSIRCLGIRCDHIVDFSEADPIGDAIDSALDRNGLYTARSRMAYVLEAGRFATQYSDTLAHGQVEDWHAVLWRVLVADRIDGQCPAPENFSHHLLRWLEAALTIINTEDRRAQDKLIDKWDKAFLLSEQLNLGAPNARIYQSSFDLACCGRRLAVTARGRLCLVPLLAEVGDEVFVPFGAQTPFVIRRTRDAESECFRLVGEAYVHGIMQGEALSDSPPATVLLV